MRLLAALLLALATAGCIYNIDIQQVNFVTQDVVVKVKPGMTKAEVRQILGTPLLIDVFHANRWDYYFSNTRGGKPIGERTLLSVHFENDKVAQVTGGGQAARATPAPAV